MYSMKNSLFKMCTYFAHFCMFCLVNMQFGGHLLKSVEVMLGVKKKIMHKLR